MLKRSFADLTLKEAMEIVPAQDILQWELSATERAPSDVLLAVLQRLESFNLVGSEPAKVMLIDTLLGEIVPLYPRLKVWKGKPLEAGTVAGIADYLIAPRCAYLEKPLLCVIRAGETQCVAEMAVCQQNNSKDGLDTEVYGIVSNGQGGAFYKLTQTPEVFGSGLFTTNDLPKLLGALDHVCAACADNAALSLR